MEILRYKSNAWGQQVLEGVSWELTGIFVVAGLVFVILHAVHVARCRKLRNQYAADK